MPPVGSPGLHYEDSSSILELVHCLVYCSHCQPACYAVDSVQESIAGKPQVTAWVLRCLNDSSISTTAARYWKDFPTILQTKNAFLIKRQCTVMSVLTIFAEKTPPGPLLNTGSIYIAICFVSSEIIDWLNNYLAAVHSSITWSLKSDGILLSRICSWKGGAQSAFPGGSRSWLTSTWGGCWKCPQRAGWPWPAEVRDRRVGETQE